MGNRNKHTLHEESIEIQLVPVQICLFFKFRLNYTIYCVIHSCHYKSKDISVLGTLWIKKYEDKTMSNFPSVTRMNENHLNAMQPYLQIIKCEAIYSQCILIPYQATSCIVIKLKHPNEWPDIKFALPWISFFSGAFLHFLTYVSAFLHHLFSHFLSP